MRIIWIILFFVFSQSLFAQDSSFLLLRTYKGDIADVALDNLDNLYIITSAGQVRKYNAGGDSMGLYNQVRNYGKITTLDVTNALRPLLFYKDFSTVVILDRFLANRSIIDLRKYNIIQASAIGLSYDNNIWVFDEYDNKLKKIDEQGNKLLETPDFRTVFDQNVRPQKIISDNGLVYLADTANGVYVFDNYGSFKKKISIKNWGSFSVKENYIFQTRKDEIIVYNTSTFIDQKKRIPSSFQPYLHSFSSHNKLVTFSTDSLRIYQYRF